MNEKKYRFAMAAITACVAIVVLAGTLTQNYLLPFIGVVTGILISLFFRNRLKDVVLEDERMRQISAVSGRIALTLFSNAAAVTGLALIIIGKNSGAAFRIAGYTLCFSVCVMLLIDLAAYFYLDRKQQA